MITRAQRHTRNRRRNGLNLPPQVDNAVVTPTVSTVTVTLTYDRPVVMNYTPDFTVTGKTITNQVQTAPNEITLTLDASGAGLDWVQADRDPAVRTTKGGYVAAKTGTFP